MNKDAVSGLVLLLISGLYYLSIGQIQDSSLADEVGPDGLPLALACLLAAFGAVLAGRAVLGLISARRSAAAAAEGDTVDSGAGLMRALGLLAFGAAYVVLLPLVGYAAAIVLLIAGVALYEGAGRNWKVPAAALFGGCLFWLMFVKLLGVDLPSGLFF